jgi:hypothetical protein
MREGFPLGDIVRQIKVVRTIMPRVSLRLVPKLDRIQLVPGTDDSKSTSGEFDSIREVVGSERNVDDVFGIRKNAISVEERWTKSSRKARETWGSSLGRDFLAQVENTVIPDSCESMGIPVELSAYSDVPPTRRNTGAPVLFDND